MKIAVVGKGGSGKTSVSRLLTQFLLSQNKTVLGIDSDHNMDYSALLGADFHDDTPSFHRFHNEFRWHVGLKEDTDRSRIILQEKYHKQFTIYPHDKYSELITQQLSNNLYMQIVGLGGEDVLFSSRCAHGHSAPLKYYLSMLQLQPDQFAIIDGVAGVDMINYGLYTGVDIVLCVVEPQKNSIRVTSQITNLLERLEMPYGVVVNKYQDNQYIEQVREIFGDSIVGHIPLDIGMTNYDLKLSTEITDSLQNLIENIVGLSPQNTGLLRLQKFESAKKNI